MPLDPEDIILGPPRTTFSSATHSRAQKSFDGDKQLKDGDTRDRFAFRNRNGEADANDRFRDRDRDGRSNFRRRGEADQDSDGWSTVKPRKSFGQEGAERFHGRMGDRPDRYGGDRRVRDQDDRENVDRPRRNFGDFAKDKDGDDGERPRRNGMNNRNRSDPPWARDNNTSESQPARERFDRAKSWRDRANADDQSGEAHTEKPRERGYERRWDRERDQRQEREPEWFDEPVEEKSQKHTEEDFKKFMESMKAGRNAATTEPTPAPAAEAPTYDDRPEPGNSQTRPAPAMELGPDKFFAAFAPSTVVDPAGKAGEIAKENILPTPAPKPKTASRFQNFFSSQEESRRQTDPPTPAAVPAVPAPEMNPLLALAGFAPVPAPAMAPGLAAGPAPKQDVAEKVAFQALLQKLQKQSLQASTTPPSAGFSEPPPNNELGGRKSSAASPSPFLPYLQERREDPLARGPLPPNQEIHIPRPQQNPHMPSVRSEQQMLHELLGQRHPMANQGPPPRTEQPPSRNNNSNAEFLMTLMQSSRGPQEFQRNEPLVMRMPQPSRPAQIPPTPDREPDFQRERHNGLQYPSGRPTGLPSFFDEPQLLHREQDNRPQQPTQILQRQPAPPGLEQMHPNSWMQAGGPQGPPPGRPMIPPPGLANNPRGAPPPGIFPPNFPMGAFPPEAMAGPPPPRNMPPPPGFFGGPGGPPGGFMPPPGMGFQAPEALGFGFDGRNMPPGAGGPFRRN